jgi:hypothetical protein
MGGFYGSIQVRTTDRAAVKAAAEAVATAKKIKCLIGPELGGWVGIYPEGNGQDDSVGREIAKQLEADVLHLLVHDDDVLAYWLWRKHELADSYLSKPGYFGDENLADEQARTGKPEMFRAIIGEKAEKLAGVLDREASPTFEYERLETLAKLLGISNAVSAYEYLKDGERDAIKGWRKFEEIPGDAIQSLARQKQAERNRVKSERAAMKKSGVLLYFKSEKEHGVRSCAVRDGFVSAWANYRGSLYIEECYPPFTTVVASTIESPAHVTAVVSNRDATRIAFAAGDRVRVWDASPEGWQHILDIPERDLTIGAAMTPDGGFIAHQSRAEIIVTQIPSGKQVFACSLVGDFRLASFDPTGRWVILGGAEMMLVDIHQAPHERVIYVGGKRGYPFSGGVPRALNIDLDKLEKRQKEAMESFISQMQATAAKSKKPVMTAEQIQKMRKEAQRALERMRAELATVTTGQGPASSTRRMQANERVHAAQVSGDGLWFFVGTSAGLRVYDWASFPKDSGSDSPAPVWQYSAPPGDDPNSSEGRVYAIAEVQGGGAIVFGGVNGQMYLMTLADGHVELLARLPTRGWIISIVFSRDGQTMAVQSVVQKLRSKESLLSPGTTWEVWSYSHLRATAAKFNAVL